MKTTKEKISFSQLLNYYSLEQLNSYRKFPEQLSDELKDVEIIGYLSQSQFNEKVMDLRKKSLEYDKTFKVCDRLAKEIYEIIQQRRTLSNKQFAYNIQSLSSQPIVPYFKQRRLLTELQLKFLEAENVDQNDWEKYFCSQEKVLYIRDKTNQYRVKLGIGLTEQKSPILSWKIQDVTSNSYHHSQLFNFLMEYHVWLMNNNKNWQNILIHQITLILNNLNIVFLFLSIREDIHRKGGQIDGQTFRIDRYKWIFEVLKKIESPKLKFYADDQLIFQIRFDQGKAYSGDIYMKLSASTLILTNKGPIFLQNYQFIYEFSMKIHNYRQIIKKFQQKYEMLNSSYDFFLKIQGHIWKPQNLVIKQQQNMNLITNGLRCQIIHQLGVIFQVEEDMSLSYPQFQRGFFGHLLSKMTLEDLLTHIHLRKDITKNNKEFQLKIYRINFLQKEKQIIYEFRSYKFSQQQKIFKIAKIQQQSMRLNQQNDNFILILRVSPDFTKVTYSAYKAMQGPQQQRQVTDNFLPKRWKQYRDNNKQKYDWRMICECITYLCKCYLVERSYNRRMTEEQRKMTIYSFK